MKKFLLWSFISLLCLSNVVVFWATSNAALSQKIDQQDKKIEALATKIDETNKNQIDLLKETYSSNYERLKDSFTSFLEVLSIIFVVLWIGAWILWFFGIKDMNKLKQDYKWLLKDMEGDYTNFKDKSKEIFEKASPQDMEKQKEEEITPEKIWEIVEQTVKNVGVKIKQDTLSKNREEQMKKNREDMIFVEKKWLEIIKALCLLEEWWLHYQEWYKISNENGDFIPDAIIWDDNNTIRLWIEIKYAPDFHMPLSIVIRRAIERIRFFKFDFPFILAIVGKNISFEDIKLYMKEFKDIKILFMNYDEEKKRVLPINVVSFSKIISLLREWDIVRHKLFWKWRILETSNGMSMVKFDSSVWLRRVENWFLTRLI